MAGRHDHGQEVRRLTRYRVRPQALEGVLAAIGEFVARVRADEPGTRHYTVWQERADPTCFVHLIVFENAEAERIHSGSAAARDFAACLSPACLAPAEFSDYRLVASNTDS